jgi:hypothetical protein
VHARLHIGGGNDINQSRAQALDLSQGTTRQRKVIGVHPQFDSHVLSHL